MPAEPHNAEYSTDDGSGFWNHGVNLEIVEIGMISCVVGCTPSETDFDQGVRCVTSSTYVKGVQVVKSVGVRYGNQALRSNREGGAAICAVADFHCGELCSISEARKRKTKRSLRVPGGVHAKPETELCASARSITAEAKRRIRRRHVGDEFIECCADPWREDETPSWKRIGGGVENCLVLQEWIQASGTWRRNGGKGVTFEIEID